MKIKVDGQEVEYDDDEVAEAVSILREDHVIAEFGSMRQQQKEILEWVNEEKGRRTNDSKPTGDGTGTGGDGDNGTPTTDPGTGDGKDNVGNGGTGTSGSGQGNSGPTPPPALTDEQKQEGKPKPRKSSWWGDAIEYDEQ